MSRMSSFTETTGFMSPQSFCWAAAGGGAAAGDDEQADAVSVAAKTGGPSTSAVFAVMDGRSLLRSQRLHHVDARRPRGRNQRREDRRDDEQRRCAEDR